MPEAPNLPSARTLSDAFTANMGAIVTGRLRAPGGDAVVIEVAGAVDDICAPCPKRRGRLCTSQARIDRLDRAHAAALRLRPGEQLTWGMAKARIRAHVPPGRLATLCAGCQWRALGLCETALRRLHDCKGLTRRELGPGQGSRQRRPQGRLPLTRTRLAHSLEKVLLTGRPRQQDLSAKGHQPFNPSRPHT